MIKAIIFDLGGVLIDNPSSKMMEYFAKTFGVSKEEFVKLYTTKYERAWSTGKITEKELWEKIATDFHTSVPNTPSLWFDAFIPNYSMHEDVFATVKSLKQHEYKLAILSNTEPPIMNYIKEQHSKEFDVSVFSCEVGLMKPGEAIYDYVLNKLGVNHDEAIFIDDNEENIQASKKKGIHSILFQNAQQLSTDLHALHLFS